MHPKNLSILDYTYELPADKIASFPLANRDESKLLVYQNKQINENVYQNLTAYLPQHTLLIFNNTKVIEARLLFEKATGGTIEIFCLEPHEQYADITTAMLQTKKVWWKCLVGGAKKWKEKKLIKKITATSYTIELSATIIEKKTDYFIIELEWNNATLSFAEILHEAGIIPLPPYLNRKAEESDKTTYQTVYAKHDGSVAAPTAGLHFTENLLTKLEEKNIHKAYVTLHVGAGTFKPVKASTMSDHEMHSEFIDVDIHTIEALMNTDERIVAVGTTSLRTIESLYWMGVKIKKEIENNNISLLPKDASAFAVQQWDPYEIEGLALTKKEALDYLLKWMQANKKESLITKTQIIIAPGYSFKVADGLITNFHQPQSTLLLLVAAIVGEEWRTIYNYALNHQFRFLSYGDGSLLWKH